MEQKLKMVLLLAFVLIITGLSMDSAWAENKKKEHIYIAAARPGDAWNVLSHALAGFINKKSEWLKADVVATAGVADDTRLVLGKKANRKNHIIVTYNPGWRYLGQGDYVPYKIGSILVLTNAWVTLDKDIKELSDLKGKVVTLPRKVKGTYTYVFIEQLREMGIWDSIKPRHGGLGASLSALRDGAAKAGVLMFDYVYPNHYALGSNLEELQSRSDIYFIQQGNVKGNTESIGKACKSESFKGLDLPNLAMTIPAKALSPKQDKEMVVVSLPIFWAASKDVSEKVVYEVTRVLYEAAKNHEFDTFHSAGKGITPDFLVTSFWDTEEEARTNYHPGALKYYDEVKLKMKSFNKLNEK